MSFKFAANISTLFAEYSSLEDRYQAAKNFGFQAVECQFPYSTKVEVLANARKKAEIEHILINSYPGDLVAGEFGYATQVKSEEDFKKSIDVTLQYSKALNCSRVHVIAGLLPENCDFSEIEETYRKNLKYAAKVFEKNDIIGLIEPICSAVKPHYFLSSFDKAIEYVKEVDSPHLRLQLDVFHMQMICGNLTDTIKAALPYVGHVQISQAPNRFEPSATGEINYRYILSLLKELKYEGWIGLEYFPSANSEDSLQWINQYGYKLSDNVECLHDLEKLANLLCK